MKNKGVIAHSAKLKGESKVKSLIYHEGHEDCEVKILKEKNRHFYDEEHEALEENREIHLWVSITLATKDTNRVMPDLIRHPLSSWIPAFAGMTAIGMSNCHST